MDEKRTRQQKNKAEEKDFYSPVVILQFFVLVIIVAVLFLSCRFGGTFGEEIKEKLSFYLNHTSTSEELSSAMSFFGGLFDGDGLAVFGSSVTDVATAGNALNNAPSLPSGGEDLEHFEAAEKTSFAPYKLTDKMLSPIENGRYTSYFGYRTNPITGKWSFHTGLDIAAPEGTKIRCVLPGTVTRIDEDSRAGKYIFITHSDGFQTFYCHCSEIVAEVGMKLNKGETIALVGSTGWSTGPHLHFEVRKDNIRLNPLLALEDDC